jgi:hypothetical protein
MGVVVVDMDEFALSKSKQEFQRFCDPRHTASNSWPLHLAYLALQ